MTGNGSTVNIQKRVKTQKTEDESEGQSFG
jgi:hypothetical protein